MSSAAATLKQQKEDFVSNLSGGSVSEVNAIAGVAPVSLTLRDASINLLRRG